MIELPSYFELSERADQPVVDLLTSVSLGTNGTIYRHLNTENRIAEIDNPLFLSFRRNNRALGNITFCKRGSDWYIRYFAFDQLVQSSGQQKSKSGKKKGVKGEIESFFAQVLEGKAESDVNTLYAYIDPRNEKSLWMAEQFEFEHLRSISTQTFSRLRPRYNSDLVELEWSDVKDQLCKEYQFHRFFHTETTSRGPIFGIKKHGEIVAFTKITLAEWEIKRLPGRMGSVLVRILPKIPILNRLINPKNHAFIVPEAVYVKGGDPKLMEQLFEGILAHYQRNLMIWWVDDEDFLYRKVKRKIRWGILNRILGVNKVNLMVRSSSKPNMEDHTPAYICGIDFV